MSLEQALIDATAAIKLLTTVLVTAGEATTLFTAPKAAKAAKVAPAPEPVAQAPAAANAGDPDGTRYFIIAAHNTVYKQAPGDADCTIAGAEIVSGAAYLAFQAELAKKFPTAAAPQTPAPTAPIATAQPVAASAGATTPTTFEQVVAKMRQLHAKLQNPGIQQVLTKYGVTGVPALNGKASNDTLIADIDAVMANA
jgi:hypothetical protein